MSFFLILTLLAQPQQQAQPDVVKLKNGTEVKGKITKLSAQSVTYTDSSGKTATAKRDEVRDIALGDSPSLLTKANQYAAAKNWERALNLYSSLINEAQQNKMRDLHKQFILYNWALSLEAKGDLQDALAKLKDLRKECGDCWLRPDSFRKSIDIARRVGEAALQDALTEMKSEPEPTGSEAELELAKLKYARGQHEEANAVFTRLAAKTGAPYAAEARLWSLRALRSLQRFDELEMTCGKILSDKTSASPALLQTASACVGAALLKKAGSDRNRVRDALMACAQAIAVGPPAAKDQAEDYAVSLINAARCYILLGNGSDRDEVKEDYRGRATVYLTEVIRAYRDTEWASTAQKELAVLESAPQPKDGKGK